MKCNQVAIKSTTLAGDKSVVACFLQDSHGPSLGVQDRVLAHGNADTANKGYRSCTTRKLTALHSQVSRFVFLISHRRDRWAKKLETGAASQVDRPLTRISELAFLNCNVRTSAFGLDAGVAPVFESTSYDLAFMATHHIDA